MAIASYEDLGYQAFIESSADRGTYGKACGRSNNDLDTYIPINVRLLSKNVIILNVFESRYKITKY